MLYSLKICLYGNWDTKIKNDMNASWTERDGGHTIIIKY